MDHASPNLEQLVCFNFYLGWRSIQAYYKDNLADGMTAQRMYVLALCDRERPVTVSAIAHSLTIDLPAVSGLLDRMEKDGLIQRRRVPDNRRTVHVTLTERGEQVREDHNRRLQRADIPLLQEHIKPEDLEALRRVVRGISAAVSQNHSDRPNANKPAAVDRAQSAT